jgi:hypothetical protein
VWGKITCWNADDVSVSEVVYLTILPAPTGSLTANPTSCAIPTGASSCTVGLTWNTASPIGTSAVTRDGTVGDYHTGNSGNNVPSVVPYEADSQVIFRLYNGGLELDSASVGVGCAAGPTNWDTVGDVCANPQVDSVVIDDNYTDNASIDFECSGSTAWIVKNADTDATVASGVGAGTISQSVSIPNPPWPQGNYSVTCSYGSVSDSEVVYYTYPPDPVAVFIDSYPKTIKTGDTSTINWNISFPIASCALTAAAVCANGICTDEQTAGANVLNAKISSENTDVDDPNTSRPITSAVKTIAPGHESTDHKALGKKTFSIANSTDFTVRCGATTATTRVRVANSSEQ